MQVVNNSSDSQNKNSIDICKSDKTNNTDSDHNSMQMHPKSHTNLSESSEKCDNIEFIGENTTNLNANTNTNSNSNAISITNGNGMVNASVVLSDGVQSGFVNTNSGNSNMISVTDNTINSSPNHTSQVHLNERTFTSTEAQTDDLQHQSQEQRQPNQLADAALIEPQTVKGSTKPSHSHGRRNGNDAEAQSSREQRRRERRERRQPRGSRQHVHPPNQSTSTASAALHSHHSNCEILPDILHNHVIGHPPPYTTLPMPTHCQINAASVLTQSPPPSVLVPGPPSALIPVGISDDGRYTFPLPIMRR